MSEVYSEPPILSERRSRVAAAAAGLVTMLAGNLVLAPDSAAAVKRSSVEMAHQPEALAETMDADLVKYVNCLDKLVNKGISNTYREKVNYQGRAVTRLTASTPSIKLETGVKSYTQVVAYKVPGEKLPDSIAFILGAKSPRFKTGEAFEEMDVLIKDDQHPGRYLLAELYEDRQGTWHNDYYELNKGKATFRGNSNTPVKVKASIMRGEYSAFSSRVNSLIQFVAGNPVDKPTS